MMWCFWTDISQALGSHEGCRSAGLEPASQALCCTLRPSQHAAPRGVPRAAVAGAPHEGCRSAGQEPVSQALGSHEGCRSAGLEPASQALCCTLRPSQHAAPRGVPRAAVAGAPHEGCRSAGQEPVSQALGCTLRLSQHAAPRGVPRATVQPGLTKVTNHDLRPSPMDRHRPVGAPRSAGQGQG